MIFFVLLNDILGIKKDTKLKRPNSWGTAPKLDIFDAELLNICLTN